MKHMYRPLVLATTVATLVAAIASQAFAQAAATGTVAGRVTLQDGGAPVHGATVIVVGARRQAVSGEDGRFEITNVPAGTYEVLAQREHFSAARQSVTVAAGQTASIEFSLSVEAFHEEVTVTASASGLATTFDSFSSIKSLDSVELAKSRGATIAESLANLPGVAVRSFGAGSSRPIVRGFDGDRVLIMQDGVRTGDLSSQSGDHGVSIDPAGLERLEVVKGPATLLYGSNAIGGVVNAITPQDAFRAAPFDGVLGSVTFDAGTANAMGGASASVQYGKRAWTVWAGGGSRRTGDYDTPLGPIENSSTRLTNGKAGAGWVGRSAFFSAGAQFEDSRFGVPFAGLFEGEEDAQIDIDSRRRDIRFDAGLRNLANAFLDNAKVIFAYTDYAHDEVETEDGEDAIGTTFENTTANLRFELEQKRRGRLTGRLGMEWFGRDYTAIGAEALTPPTTMSSVAGFVYEEADYGKYRLQAGGRIERTAYEVGERGESEEEPPPARNRSFTGVSGSFGLHADVGTSSAFVASLSVASRAPALEELYNFGPHIGNLAFEIGNTSLDLERTLGLDVSLRTRQPRGQAELNVYTYGISNFVFLDVTDEVEDGLRVAEYLQADSRFVGMEASASVDLPRGLHLHAGVSAVNAKLSSTDEHLPRIPPFSGRIELEIPVRQFHVSPEIVFRAAQKNVFRDEAPTDGSAVFNIGATYFVLRGHATHSIAVKAFNLTNTEYRQHTSFIKDLAPEIGRGIRVSYSVKFF